MAQTKRPRRLLQTKNQSTKVPVTTVQESTGKNGDKKMSWVHVKAILKMALAMVIGIWMTSGLGMILAFLFLPNLTENVEFIVNYFVIERGTSTTTVLLLFFTGLTTIAVSLWTYGLIFGFKVVKMFIGWDKEKEMYPRLKELFE